MNISITSLFCWVLLPGLTAAPLVWTGEIRYVPTFGPTPVWRGEALRILDRLDGKTVTIRLIGRDGVELTPHVFSAPGASVVRVNDAALVPKNRLLVCGVMHDNDGRGGGYLAIVDRVTGNTRIVSLSPFYPYLVAPGTDGSIWLQGKESGSGANPDRGVLRQFDRDGKLIRELIPDSGLQFLDAASNINHLASSAGRVAWYSRNKSAYFEVNEQTGEVLRFPGPPLTGKGAWEFGMALTDKGSSFVAVTSEDGARVYRLDRTQKMWIPETLPATPGGERLAFLYGGDGKTLAVQFVGKEWIQFASE